MSGASRLVSKIFYVEIGFESYLLKAIDCTFHDPGKSPNRIDVFARKKAFKIFRRFYRKKITAVDKTLEHYK